MNALGNTKTTAAIFGEPGIQGGLFGNAEGCKTLVGERYAYRDIEIDEDTKPEDIGEYYPERQQEHLIVKKYFAIPGILKQVYTEVISCFNRSHYLLCSVGLRMLLEGILNVKGVAGQNLKARIDKADFIP
ncbi:Uncharacterised protein [uncultured archaeon]|nr:Uncharacterised protein [uncultured archaeon]